MYVKGSTLLVHYVEARNESVVIEGQLLATTDYLLEDACEDGNEAVGVPRRRVQIFKVFVIVVTKSLPPEACSMLA